MKSMYFRFAVLAMAMFVPARSAGPIDKVLTMLADLASEVQAQSAAAKVTYEKFATSCQDRSAEYGNEIKTGKSQIEELTATIGNEAAKEEKFSSEIEELSGAISTADSDLAAAKSVRDSEAADFKKEEAELVETIGTLERAISILSKHGAASMLQTQYPRNLVQALTAMVQASMLSKADASRLTALTQTYAAADDSDTDSEPDAPAAAVYEGHSGGIVDTLSSLLEKAQGQLDDARKAEATSIHNYQMLKQSLSDQIKYSTEDLEKSKLGLHTSKEVRSTAEGDLSVSKADVADTEALLKELKSDCMSAAEEYEAAEKGRAEELEAVTKATAALKEAMKGASFVANDRGAMSFVQVGKTKSSGDAANLEVVRFVRKLAREQRSPALAQLAARMKSIIKMGAAVGEDPFAKVKALIVDLIDSLERTGDAEADHKAYCDKQLSETKAKFEDSSGHLKELKVSLEQSQAHSAKLKEEVADLEKELSDSANAAAKAGILRQEEKAEFESNKAELEKGIEGVKLAVQVLKEYYAKGEASQDTTGYSSGIISLLEVIESDLSKELAEAKTVEALAAEDYEADSKALEISTASKEQDVKYKTKEAAALDKKISELEADMANEQSELDAVLEYMDKITSQCTTKVEPYAERVARREAEINGLKEALSILDGETVFLQQAVKRRALRGVLAHKF